MTQDRLKELFFELFSDLPRQGPGDTSSTLRALGMVPPLGPNSRVLDVGCGTGTQTLVLARHTSARIVAVDNHAPFVDQLRCRAAAAGLAERLEARVMDMNRLEFPDRDFDLIWSEGAIYQMGFDDGLREWRRLLASGGHLAVSEACWLTDRAPQECRDFWEREYPAIRDVSANLDAIAQNGYRPIGHFALPGSSWWDDYYTPLGRRLEAFRLRYCGDLEALGLADAVEREIDMHRQHGEHYGYVFFIMRREERS